MIEAQILDQILKQAGFNFYTGVPCSYLKPFINYVIDHNPNNYVIATSEGEAVGIAAGAYCTGKMPVVIMQNSGLGNTVNPVTSLNAISDIPCLLIVTQRGEPGKPDAQQHTLMGKITHSVMDVIEVPNQTLPETESEITAVIKTACEYIQTFKKPYGLVLKKGTIAPYQLKNTGIVPPPKSRSYMDRQYTLEPTLNRYETIQIISDFLEEHQIATVATTGKMSRELFDIRDRDYCFYMVGSMGCAAAIGFGVAFNQPQQKVAVLDGDGAVLMKMGSLATIGNYNPQNLLHIVVDNGAYETTGGQETVANSVDFLTVAAACGYQKLYFATTEKEVTQALNSAYQSQQLSMIHIRIKPKAYVDHEIGRPTLTPPQVTERFRDFLKTHS